METDRLEFRQNRELSKDNCALPACLREWAGRDRQVMTRQMGLERLRDAFFVHCLRACISCDRKNRFG